MSEHLAAAKELVRSAIAKIGARLAELQLEVGDLHAASAALGLAIGTVGKICLVVGDACFELREVLDTASAPPALTPERAEQLHAGIMARVAAETPPPFNEPFRVSPGTAVLPFQGFH